MPNNTRMRVAKWEITDKRITCPVCGFYFKKKAFKYMATLSKESVHIPIEKNGFPCCPICISYMDGAQLDEQFEKEKACSHQTK